MIITKIEKQKKDKNRSSVFIDDNFAFGIDDFDLFKLKLKVGLTISESQLSNIKETILFTSAKEYSIELISHFRYTEKTMYEKLKNREYDEETILKTLDFLKNYDFINDYEYAKSYINDALNFKKSGFKKIRYELMQKGINNEIINKVMSEFDVELIEEKNILPLAKKKLNDNFEYKNIMKVKRYLISKGFSFELIDKTIDSVLRGEGE